MTIESLMFSRWYSRILEKEVAKPFVHVLFGARQTGKSTLIRRILPLDALIVDLADPVERRRYQLNPEIFLKECRSLPRKGPSFVFVDEAPYLPEIFDAVQHLYDQEKRRWRFILCGSSARKLRRTGANLLPGRSFLHRLFPLTLAEHPTASIGSNGANTAFPLSFGRSLENPFPAWDLEERLAYGALPGIVSDDEENRPRLLKSYAALHLEEEIRRETHIRDWHAFSRFLQLAASESGQIVNFSTISREAGVSLPTVKSYYQLLEDRFIGFQLPAFSSSKRKNVLRSPRFFFFDLGVRNAVTGMSPSREGIFASRPALFEQWVGMELWRRTQYLEEGRLSYFRTASRMEVDFILEWKKRFYPIEVKWTTNPTNADSRHLRTFLDEHPEKAKKGFIICRCPRPMEMDERITAIPWDHL